MVFRGSLNLYVTAVDHLWYDHLSSANSLAIATLETLGPDHPVRRLNTKFFFRTITINELASEMLSVSGGLLNRGSSLSAKGLAQIYNVASAQNTGVNLHLNFRSTVYEGFNATGLPAEMAEELPYYKDGMAYYDILRQYVSDYMRVNGYDEKTSEDPTRTTRDACGSDADLLAFVDGLNSAVRHFSVPYGAGGATAPVGSNGELTCKKLIDIMTGNFWDVSGYHNVVGTLGSENADPCFAPWTFDEGAMCGKPKPGFVQQITFMLTGLYQPEITENYEHLFISEESKQVERDFLVKIMEFSDSLNDRPGYVTFKPSQNMTGVLIEPMAYAGQYANRHFGIETSIAI